MARDSDHNATARKEHHKGPTERLRLRSLFWCPTL